MKRLLLAVPVLFAPTVLVDSVVGQAVPPRNGRGIFTSFPFGMTTTAAHRDIEFGPGISDKVRLRGANANGSEPWTNGLFVGPGSPDYGTQTLFAWSNDAASRYPEIGAMTTGNSFLPNVDDTGNLQVNNLWATIVASVSHDSAPYGAGSLFQDGADLVSFTFTNSAHVHPDFPGTTRVEQRSNEIGFASHAAPDIDGMDYAMGLIHINPRDRIDFEPDDFIARRNEFFFSVDKDWANANKDFVMTAAGDTVDPAVVYHSIWDGVTWSQPTIRWDRTALGLADAPIDPTADFVEDVDAIMYSIITDVLIFSTQIRLGRDQLRVIQANDPAEDLKDNGTLVTSRYGLDSDDDIDSLCGDDPEGPHTLGYIIGTPVASSFDQPNTQRMSLSVCRQTQVDASGNPFAFHWHFAIGGWGAAAAQDATIVLMIEMEYQLSSSTTMKLPFFHTLSRGKEEEVFTHLFSVPANAYMADDYTNMMIPGVLGTTNQWGEMTVWAKMTSDATGLPLTASHAVKLKL